MNSKKLIALTLATAMAVTSLVVPESMSGTTYAAESMVFDSGAVTVDDDGTVSVTFPSSGQYAATLRLEGKSVEAGSVEILAPIDGQYSILEGESSTAKTTTGDITGGEEITKALAAGKCSITVDVKGYAYKGKKVTVKLPAGEYSVNLNTNHSKWVSESEAFTIKKQLSEEEAKEYVMYTEPKDLVYTGLDQSEVVKKAVTLNDDGEWSIDEITFEKNGETTKVLKNAGTYNVNVKISSETEISTVNVGKVTIAKKEVAPVINAVIAPVQYGWAVADVYAELSEYGEITVSESAIQMDYDTKYLENVGYDDDTVRFVLTSEAVQVTAPTETIISVNLSEAYENYSVNLWIPVAIVPEKYAVIPFDLTQYSFEYDGYMKTLEYRLLGSGMGQYDTNIDDAAVEAEKVSSAAIDAGMTLDDLGGSGVESFWTAGQSNEVLQEVFGEGFGADGKVIERIIQKNDYLGQEVDKEVDYITDAGTYVVQTVVSGASIYGALIREVTVTPGTIPEEVVQQDWTLDLGTGSALVYDGKTDYTDTIKGYVKVSDRASKVPYDIKLLGHSVVGGASQAGTVTVQVKVDMGVYASDWITIGTVKIAKAKTADLDVTDDGKGNLTVKFDGKKIKADELKIEYYAKGSNTKLDAKPTGNGEYTAKISVKDTTNFDSDVKVYDYKISGAESSSSDKGSGSGSGSSGSASNSGSTSGSGSASGSGSVSGDVTADEVDNFIVTVDKDVYGDVKKASAVLTVQNVNGKTKIPKSTIEDIKKAAGTRDVTLTIKVVDENYNVIHKVKAKTSDLVVGKKLKVLRVNKKTGKRYLVNASTYTVQDGYLVMRNLGKNKKTYELVDLSTEKALTKKILKNVKLVKKNTTVEVGNKTKTKISKKLSLANVKKITYRSGKKFVATVNKFGKIVAKHTGVTKVKAKVILQNGKSKVVSMRVRVKK